MSMLKGPKRSLWPFFSKVFIFGAFLYTLLGMWFHDGPEIIMVLNFSREEMYFAMSAILLVMGLLASIPSDDKSR